MIIQLLSAAIIALSACLVYLLFHQSSIHLNNRNINKNFGNNTAKELTSSVWCYYDRTHNKICTFQNLYYIPEEKTFIFLLTNESVVSGLESKNDFKIINLSSVENHNNMGLKLQIVINNSGQFNGDGFISIPEPILLVKRFKPDNIMHVIHDDILPIFMTYSHLCSGNIDECVHNNRLMFADDKNEGPYSEWYKLFSNKKPFNLKNLKKSRFDKIFVGVTRETVWYQYGFGKPHGPIESASINSLITNRFGDFILNKFLIKSVPTVSNEEFINIVLLSRKNNRKILNENFVVNVILEVYRSVFPEDNKIIKIHKLDPSHNKSTDILNTIIRSQILIGMHGSAMIYSLFLPKNSAIVELFPFGIQPQHVSSTRALCQLPGLFYNYLSWRNFKEDNSISHPDRPDLLGGIKHLSAAQQDVIKKLKTIPAVECCHDSAYLYRMFQDTIVDDSFKIILKQALINQKEIIQAGSRMYLNEYMQTNWFFPGPVSNISCIVDKKIGVVQIIWSQPYNIQILNVVKVTGFTLYQIAIKIFTRTVTLETFSSTVSVKLTSEEVNSLVLENNIQFWIKTIFEDTEGSDIHSYCL